MSKVRHLAVSFMAAVILYASVSFADTGDLGYLARNFNGRINVFLTDFTNSSGQDRISADDFKKELAASLSRRKTLEFTAADSSGASDIQISCNIKKYAFSETDPINSYAGTPGVLLDAVTTQHYAEMTGEFIVIDTRSGKVIWKNDVMAFVEGEINAEEAISPLYNKLARAFLTKTFGKPNR